MPDIISSALPHVLNVVKRFVDMGDATQAELGYAFSTAGPPVGSQSAVVFSGQTGVLTAGATVTPTDQISGTTNYVVPKGFKLYITDINVGANSATQFEFQIQASNGARGATVLFRQFCKGDTGPIQLVGLETQNPFLSGETVSLIFGTAASTTADFFVSGYLSPR